MFNIVISYFELINNEFVSFLFVIFSSGLQFKRKEKKGVTNPALKVKY